MSLFFPHLFPFISITIKLQLFHIFVNTQRNVNAWFPWVFDSAFLQSYYIYIVYFVACVCSFIRSVAMQCDWKKINGRTMQQKTPFNEWNIYIKTINSGPYRMTLNRINPNRIHWLIFFSAHSLRVFFNAQRCVCVFCLCLSLWKSVVELWVFIVWILELNWFPFFCRLSPPPPPPEC